MIVVVVRTAIKCELKPKLCQFTTEKMNGKQLVALLLTTLYGLVVSDERIYGGYRIDIKDAPYMASITILIEQFHNGTSKVLECGGSILRPNLILTAAHCE